LVEQEPPGTELVRPGAFLQYRLPMTDWTPVRVLAVRETRVWLDAPALERTIAVERVAVDDGTARWRKPPWGT